MSLIADLIRAGVDPELVQRVSDELAAARAQGAADAAPQKSAAAIRQARYRERKASQTVTNHNNVTLVTECDANVTPAADPRARVVNTTLPSEEISNIPPLVPPPVETAPRKASRAKPRTAIDPDLEPNDRNRADAAAAGLAGREARDEWRRFVDCHAAKGSLMASWDAAWRTWLGNRQRFARAGPAAPQRSILSRIATGEYFDEPDSEHHDQPGARTADASGGRSSGDVSQRAGADGGGAVVDLRPTGTGWR